MGMADLLLLLVNHVLGMSHNLGCLLLGLDLGDGHGGGHLLLLMLDLLLLLLLVMLLGSKLFGSKLLSLLMGNHLLMKL
jgi:hypothetical protein